MIQKIREATRLLIENLVLFSAIVLTVWLPGSILLVYLRLYIFPETSGGDELRMFAEEFRVSSAIDLAFSPIYVGAIIYSTSQLKQGLHATYSASMAHAARRSFKLLGTRIGTGLMVLAGLVAFIIPGVFLMLRFALIDAVVVLEGIDGKRARNLSTQLTQGKKWNILGTMILASIGIIIISFILDLPLSFIGKDENFIVAVISECMLNILLVLPTIILFLFYWDAKNKPVVS
jgi:hypothetical protein